MRGRALRADSSARLSDVLPLHPLSAPYRHRSIRQRPGRARHLPDHHGDLRVVLQEHVTHTGGDDPQIGVRLGAFDEDPGIRPVAHQFVAYAAAWEQIPEDGLPRFPEQRVAD